MIDRSVPPPIKDAVSFNLQLKACVPFALGNGIPVYSIAAGAQEVVMVEWVFDAGNWYENKNIVAATTNYLLKNGTTQKNAFAINEYVEGYGAYLNRSCYNETATITLHCLSKHLGELLPMVAELIMEANFPEEELQTYRKNQQQRLAVNLKKCDFIANRLIDEYVYGFHHPYGTYTSTLDYEALQREDLVAYHQQFYAQGACKIFVAGKLPQGWEALLEQHFSPLPLNQKPIATKTFAPTPASEKKYRIVNDESGVQGAIRLARPFPNRHHPDFQKAMILNNVFGGFFGSRLMSNIREDKGYTYGIHSYVQNHIHTSAWMISTEAGREVCEPTITEVYKEMHQLATAPIPADELHLVRNYMLGSILGELDGPFQLIARWKNYLLNNLTEAYFYNSLDTIRHTSAEELQELAKKWLNPADFYELVVV